MKSAILLALCCSLFAGCRIDNPPSSKVPATPESFAKKVEQVNLKVEHIVQHADRWPKSSAEFLASIHAMRDAWTEYLRVEPEQRAKLAAISATNGVVFGEQYYRMQEQFLDGFSSMLQQTEDLMVKTP
jgi:hypothetical protein